MRLRTRLFGPALLLSASAIALWPAVAQRAPESILPPGFGQPEPANTAAPTADGNSTTPADVPELALRPPVATAPQDGALDDVIESVGNNATAEVVAPLDLPPQARRSLNLVGLVDVADAGLAPEAFAGFDGGFLGTLMRRIDAPLASRWSTILMRRALLSQSETPPGINGADWVAERAWLLLRMGDAENARALVARVDAENFTPRLFEVAMQAALATGDPGTLCPIANAAAAVSEEVSWPLAQAMCAAMSGEAGTASALIDKIRDDGDARGIDVLLAEKVVGAATNSRRSVAIQWDGIDRLTAWRFGIANATGVVIPPRLFETAGAQVQAWQARAPLVPATVRAPAVERAAALGIWSNVDLVNFFGGLWDATDPGERGGSVAAQLRDAYTASGQAERLTAIRALWTGGDLYAREVLTARAALGVMPSATVPGDDSARLIAAMLSAGLDVQAQRWGRQVASGSLSWGLLAVGAPMVPSGITGAAVRAVPGGADDRTVKFLLSGLAGLGRLSADDASALAASYKVPLGRENSWTRALDRAVSAHAPSAVALIAAAGLQTREWRNVPPEHLYRIVSALRRVGLEPEARMIAAEAVARS